MFIVKKKSEIVRFGIFLLLAGVMAYFVASRVTAWRSVRGETHVSPGLPVQGVTVGGLETLDPIELARVSPDGADYFAEFRMGRERNRSALRETLKDVMESASASPETKKRASDQFLAVGRFASLEDQAEAMVKGKGFDDVVVSLTDGKAAHVVVKARSLTEQQSMQVIDMVARVTGVKPSAVTVMARGK